MKRESGADPSRNGYGAVTADLLDDEGVLLVEDRYVGMKVRGVYETPGGTVLHLAHRALETLTMDREVMIQRDGIIPRYAQLVYNGYWYVGRATPDELRADFRAISSEVRSDWDPIGIGEEARQGLPGRPTPV